MEGLGPHISVYLISMVKFLGGPALGPPLGLHLVETAMMSTMGMMTTVVSISLFGQKFRAFLNRFFNRRKRLFTKGNRRFVVFWRKYGIFGVSFLTPVLFSPVFGALLVNAFGGSKHKILTSMLFSAAFWSLLLAGLSTGIVQALGF